MASFSFAPSSPSGYWGGLSWSGLGQGTLTGIDAGINYANRLYDLQNRVALDPYAVTAAATGLEAQRNQNWRQGLMELARYDDMLTGAGQTNEGRYTQPVPPPAANNSPQAAQTGNSASVQQIIDASAQGAVNPWTAQAFGQPQSPYYRPGYSFLFGGM